VLRKGGGAFSLLLPKENCQHGVSSDASARGVPLSAGRAIGVAELRFQFGNGGRFCPLTGAGECLDGLQRKPGVPSKADAGSYPQLSERDHAMPVGALLGLTVTILKSRRGCE